MIDLANDLESDPRETRSCPVDMTDMDNVEVMLPLPIRDNVYAEVKDTLMTDEGTDEIN